MRRSSGHAGVALGHRVLHLDRAAHRVDHAAELDQRPVAGALDHAAVVHRDGRVDQVAAQGAQPGKVAVLVGPGQPAEADHVGGEDSREFPALRHSFRPDALAHGPRPTPWNIQPPTGEAY